MGVPVDNDVAALLQAAATGDSDALNLLLPLLYDELHELAHRQRRRQNGPPTLNTTALLHEAYLKLVRANGSFHNRTHFFRIAARAMRQILTDYARRQLAGKRAGANAAGTFDEEIFLFAERSEEILALDEALERLSTLNPRQGEVVEMRYFAGFTMPEAADLLGLSPATVWRDWAAAQAWLQQELSS